MSKKIDYIRIMAIIHGDFSRLLIGLNFLFCLYQYLDDKTIHLHISGHKNKSVNDLLMKEQEFIARYMSEKKWEKVDYKNYDLVLDINVYPEVLHCTNRIKENETLYKLVKQWKRFQLDPDNKLYFESREASLPYVYTRLMIEKKTILNSADVFGNLCIGTSYRLPVQYGLEKEQVLSKYQLNDQKFISVHWTDNPIFAEERYPMMWGFENYTELIRLWKEKYPEYQVIQLGRKSEEGKTIPGIDLNLSGKLKLEELKIILSQSELHIDGDSYLVHFRAYLHGGTSVVLYGPTPKDLFSYPENINISSESCQNWCAGLREDWKYRCIKNNMVDCMKGIMPVSVMEAVEQYVSDG